MGVGISECISFENLNVAGIWSLLKADCVTCDMHMRREVGTRCPDCNFIFNSKYNHKKQGTKPSRSRVGCGAKFKQFGLNENYSHVGKHQLYFFLFHPELNFKLPEFPSHDMFGNPQTPNWYWHIHHLNHLYWDDSKDNLMLCINTEHKFIEASGIKLWRWNY